VNGADASQAHAAATSRVSGSLLVRLSSLGASAQSAIPALYAWGVTVAPCAFARGASVLAKVTSILALAVLAAAIVLERRRPSLSRPVFVWGFAACCVLTWALAPQGLSPAKLDAARGFLGAVGWLMVAFSAAAPPLRRAPAGGRIVQGAKLQPRSRVASGDGIFVAVAFACAVALQAIGWGVVATERALLVRAVTLVSGVAIIGAATDVATYRHQTRKAASSRVRLQRVWPAAGILVLLGLAAAAYVIFRTG
jgi:hypothetical protein